MKDYKEQLNDFCNLIMSAQIISKEQADKYFSIYKIPEKVQKNLIRDITRKQICFYDESKNYFVAARNITYTVFTPDLEKAIWTYLFYLEKKPMSFVNFYPKVPACAFFMSNSTIDNIFERTVFYIPKGNVDLTLRIIETNYGGFKSPVNTILILDDFSYVNQLKFSEGFVIQDVIYIDENKKVYSARKD